MAASTERAITGVVNAMTHRSMWSTSRRGEHSAMRRATLGPEGGGLPTALHAFALGGGWYEPHAELVAGIVPTHRGGEYASRRYPANNDWSNDTGPGHDGAYAEADETPAR